MTPTGRSADVRDAIFGNVGTIVVFRVGAEDAEFLEKEFTPEFTAGDLVNLPKYNIDLKLMIDGVAGSAFSAETLPPFPKSEESNREKIIKASRERYSVLKKIVEEKITKWLGALKSPEVPLQEFRQVLYDAKCSLCGKWTKVTFEPDASRPVYCKTCLKKVRPAAARVSEAEVENEKRDFSEKKKTSSTFSLQEAVGREPISFFGNREVKKTKEEKKTKRKEVNLEELKKTLEESLKGIETKKDENNQRV
jgi:CxxC-x17-CxxC domain-containing protein